MAVNSVLTYVDNLIDNAKLIGANEAVLKSYRSQYASGSITSRELLKEVARHLNVDNFPDIQTMDQPETVSRIMPTYSSGDYVIVSGVLGFNINLSSLATYGDGIVIKGKESGDRAGYSVSSAGDWNGDGIEDVIIGAPYADPNDQNSAGECYIVYGQNAASGLTINLDSLVSENKGVVIQGVGAGDRSGSSVSSAGDWNGDGIDDVIIGAPYADPNSKNSAGECYIVYGQGTTEGQTIDLSNLVDSSNGALIQGAIRDGAVGYSVSSAGDWNGDGIKDVIVGAPYADIDEELISVGLSYIIYGQDTDNGVTIDLSNLVDDNKGVAIQGAGASDRTGLSVSSAGDWNNDGIKDVIVGASTADPNEKTSAGVSYVVYGQDTTAGLNIDLSSLVGDNKGVVIQGAAEDDTSGSSVSAAGDWNRDGIDDVVIGAKAAEPNDKSLAGESYIVYGQDTDNGVTIDLASLVGDDNGVVIQGASLGDTSGFSVSTAGDWNNDGSPEVIIGARYASTENGVSEGISYILFSQDTDNGVTIDLSSLVDDNKGVAIQGISNSDASGYSVSAAGDWNGDGIPDVIIGAPYADLSDNDSAGEFYIVFGGEL